MNKFVPLFILIINSAAIDYAQSLPANETQVNLSSYFDSFNVTVVYPSISVNRRISESTSLTGGYLVDMISAASTKGYKAVPGVDVVTSASDKNVTAKKDSPLFGEIRHQLNIGFAQLIGSGILSFDGLYSTEHDYTSSTIIGNFKNYFAQQNTSVELGIIKSWDMVFPSTKNWKKDRNVFTIDLNFSQVISKQMVVQLLTTYSEKSGLLSDNYLLVPVSVFGIDSLFDPVHPSLRVRRAAALSLKYRLNDKSSIQLGYRYYRDSWDINANTFSVGYQRYLSENIILGIGWRGNIQTKAFFFKPWYTNSDHYRTVDIKLDNGHSNELQIDLVLSGGEKQNFLPFLEDKHIQYILNLMLYSRHTGSPYWFNNLKDLFAAGINIGIRYRY